MTGVLCSTWLVLALQAAAPEDAAPLPVGPGGRIFDPPAYLDFLVRPYAGHVPLAPRGERLWASHPGGWAFGSGTNYYLLTGHGVGFDLIIEADGAQVAAEGETSYPSHATVNGAQGGVAVAGAKWITRDDVLAVEVLARNTGYDAAGLTFTVALPAGDVETAAGAVRWESSIHGLDVTQMTRLPGYTLIPKGPEPAVASVEGEAPQDQRGSEWDDTKPAASGGRVLGAEWGGDQGDYAVWRLETPEPLDNAVLSIRYARYRPDDGPAAFRVELDGTELAASQPFPATGGWGSYAAHLRVLDIPIGELAAGRHTVRLEALADDSNVNVDTLFLRPPGVPLPDARDALTRFEKRLTLEPGQSRRERLFLAAGTRADEVEDALERVSALEDPLADQEGAIADWFEANVPVFVCDEAFTRQYWHRQLGVNFKNLFRVGEGRLPRWAIAEGCWTASWYSNMISYGAGHQIRELRWLRDPRYVRDVITTWCENPKDTGIFPSHITPNSIGGGQYTDWITSAVWDAYRVAPDRRLLSPWADALQANVDGWLAEYDQDGDGLLLVDSHWWTGMEWQPSFFYFNGYDKDDQDGALERVDLTAYVYGNAKHLSALLAELGDDAGAKRYGDIATKIKAAVRAHMWREDGGYFYSLAPGTHEPARIKEVIGVYPYYFGMLDDPKYLEAWASLLDPEQLWTDWPVASVSQQCPAYSQDVLFHGEQVGGCMWNGPTWPHANSLVLSAMGETLRTFGEAGPLTASHFYELLRSYTMAQFRDQDLTFPWTGEYYDGNTGQWRTSMREYNHSTYADVLIGDLCGLRPRTDDVLELRPVIPEEMPSFYFDGVRYHGRDLAICWNGAVAGAVSPDGEEGFRVYVDGLLVHHSKEPQDIELPGYGVPAQP